MRGWGVHAGKFRPPISARPSLFGRGRRLPWKGKRKEGTNEFNSIWTHPPQRSWLAHLTLDNTNTSLSCCNFVRTASAATAIYRPSRQRRAFALSSARSASHVRAECLAGTARIVVASSWAVRVVRPPSSPSFLPPVSAYSSQPAALLCNSRVHLGRASRSLVSAVRRIKPMRHGVCNRYRAAMLVHTGVVRHGVSRVCSARRARQGLHLSAVRHSACKQCRQCRLTPPSSGRSKGRCAPFGPPLMSNVRPPNPPHVRCQRPKHHPCSPWRARRWRSPCRGHVRVVGQAVGRSNTGE